MEKVTKSISRTGEALVRTRIAALDVRVKALNAAQTSDKLGPRVVRARLRYARFDYEKLCVVARRYGFEV